MIRIAAAARGRAQSPMSDATFLTLQRDDPSPPLENSGLHPGPLGRGQCAQGLTQSGGGSSKPKPGCLQGLRDDGHSGHGLRHASAAPQVTGHKRPCRAGPRPLRAAGESCPDQNQEAKWRGQARMEAEDRLCTREQGPGARLGLGLRGPGSQGRGQTGSRRDQPGRHRPQGGRCWGCCAALLTVSASG